jgi:imidazolonepropionase-like amidohydrolase
MQELVRKEKKVVDEIEPLTEVFMDVLSGRFKMMFHVHKEDDVMILIKIVKEFGIKAVANHCCDVHREEIFASLRASSVPIIYGPMDAFPYKVELRHESWRNAEKLLRSGAKFSVISDHPVILQRNILYSLRHMLRFGLSKADAISKISKEAAEIIGAEKIGQIKPGFKASLVVWNGDPFSLSSYPILVIAEGRTVYDDR